VTVKRILAAAALVLVLAAFFGLYSTRLWDVDFWWHLAFGRVIVQTTALPVGDPFGVYPTVTGAGSTILKGYWLFQALFYAVFEGLGAGGIVALKAGILTSCLLVLHRRAISAGAHAAAAYLVTVLAGLVLTSFTGERPQLASFLFAGIVFLLLDRYRADGRERWLYGLPPLMLLWANCHGGVLLGAVLIAGFALALTVERWRAGSGDGGRARNVFLGIAGLSVAMAFASPVGWNVALTVLQQEGSTIRNRVSEYASPLELWRTVGLVQFYPYVLLVALALLSLYPLLRERRLPEAALILILAALGMRAYRYVPFFLLVGGPYVAAGLTRLGDRLLQRLPAIDALVAGAAAVAILLGARSGAMFQSGIEEERYPTGAVARLREAGAAGRVLTSFEWGGYVIWNLGGKLRPYVDSRNLDAAKFARYTHMIWATAQGLDVLARERFDYALVPRVSFVTRERYPLGAALSADPRWVLVYQDPKAMLFAAR